MEIRDIFKSYREQKREIEITIPEMKAALGGMIHKIVLYGAGSAGIAFLHYLRDAGISPVYFADGDSDKWGSFCEGLEIIDYKEIVQRIGTDALVIVTINTDGMNYCKSFTESLRRGGHLGVHKALAESGCKNIIDYVYFRRCHELFRGDRYNLPSCSDVRLMEAQEEKIYKVFSLLEDAESKEILSKIIQFRLLDDRVQIPTRPQENQYFEKSFYSNTDNAVFVDCGAYNGISLKTFLKICGGKFQRYYGLEPDQVNYDKLKEYAGCLPPNIREKINLFQVAAYAEKDIVRMYALHGPGSFLSNDGGEEARTIRLDDLLGQEKVTYIKMNIEGAEKQALKGARGVITGCRPELAIAGYHKTDDLWEIPFIIHEMCPDYHLHLRSYMNHISFVYYACINH